MATKLPTSIIARYGIWLPWKQAVTPRNNHCLHYHLEHGHEVCYVSSDINEMITLIFILL